MVDETECPPTPTPDMTVRGAINLRSHWEAKNDLRSIIAFWREGKTLTAFSATLSSWAMELGVTPEPPPWLDSVEAALSGQSDLDNKLIEGALTSVTAAHRDQVNKLEDALAWALNRILYASVEQARSGDVVTFDGQSGDEVVEKIEGIVGDVRARARTREGGAGGGFKRGVAPMVGGDAEG